jgi:hypothetical protein
MHPLSTKRQRGVVAILLFAVTLTTACSGSGRAQLIDEVGGGSPCMSSTSSADWIAKRTVPTLLGLDEISTRSNALITLISADVLGKTAGMSVVHTALIPTGSIGAGGSWGPESFTQFPAEWRDRAEFPGGTVKLVKDSGAAGYDPTYPAGNYELVVAVLPSSDAGGTAQAILMKYKVGGHTFSLKSHLPFGITKSHLDCP